MKRLLGTAILSLFGISVNAQTWNGEVAQIIYDNCAACHNPNGAGSVPFMSYAETEPYKSTISAYVSANIMPPWTADTSFQHYYQERTLTEFERTTILDWVSAGAPEGTGSAPPAPVFAEKILPGVPDLSVQLDAYMSQASPTSDDYICVAIPSGLTEDKKLRAMEVIPGNRPIVHHCLVYHDEDGSFVTDSTSGVCSGPSDVEDLLGGYAPGSQPTIFPADETAGWRSGMEMKAGSQIILSLHYPEGSYGEWDSTVVNFYFYDEPVAGFREIWALPLIQDFGFTIPADVVDTITGSFFSTPTAYSAFACLPHMHLLGESVETYGLDPSLDTIPFVRIPDWDFDWQDIYTFEYLLKVPTGSDIEAMSVYNNTSSNPYNPNDPPEDVSAGLNTSDEMFLFYYMFMLYQTGDEYFSVDSATTVFMSTQPDDDLYGFGDLKVFPNPFDNLVSLSYTLNSDADVNLYIYDTQGRLINKLQKGKQTKGLQTLLWDGKNEEGIEVRSGVYFYSMTVDGLPYSGRIIKQ